jgi:hypothetical protein
VSFLAIRWAPDGGGTHTIFHIVSETKNPLSRFLSFIRRTVQRVVLCFVRIFLKRSLSASSEKKRNSIGGHDDALECVGG